VPPPTLKMIDHGVKPGDRASHLTSVQYHLALAACDPAGLLDVAHSPAALAPGVRDFMARISVAVDAALLVHYPKAWPARIVVHTKDGVREATVIHVPGDPQRPFDERAVCDKFRAVAARPDVGGSVDLLERCRAAFAAPHWPADLVAAISRAEGAR
jgi:2-methylcitrate dehydratase PrpD